jgi:hypothetical protein
VTSVRSDDTLAAAARVVVDDRNAAAIAIPHHDRVLGVITDRDVCMAAYLSIAFAACPSSACKCA